MTHSGANSSGSLGRLSRLKRLTSGGPIHLLAMDHAVTDGWYHGQDSPEQIARDCSEFRVNGVVCHRGMIRLLPEAARLPVFLQLYGSSSLGTAKAQLLRPDHALTLDCVGVSVELDVDAAGPNLALAFETVEHAQRVGLLTLLMLAYSGVTAGSMARALAIGTQLGSDFIKVRLPTTDLSIAADGQLCEAVRRAPPLLLAGGVPDGSLKEKLTVARKLGFRGTCIGRNYFYASERSNTAKIIADEFGDPSDGAYDRSQT